MYILTLLYCQYIIFSTRSTFDFFTDMRHFIHYEYSWIYVLYLDLGIDTYFIYVWIQGHVSCKAAQVWISIYWPSNADLTYTYLIIYISPPLPGCTSRNTPWEQLRSCKTIVMFRLRRFTAGYSVRWSARHTVTLSHCHTHLRLLWSLHHWRSSLLFVCGSFLLLKQQFCQVLVICVTMYLLIFCPVLQVLFLKNTYSLVKGRRWLPPRTPPGPLGQDFLHGAVARLPSGQCPVTGDSGTGNARNNSSRKCHQRDNADRWATTLFATTIGNGLG